MKKHIKTLMAFLLAFITLLCACEKPQPEIPKLIEPKTRETIYEKAQYRDFGPSASDLDKKTLFARAVPEEYGQFFKKGTIVSQILVSIGEYVEKGDEIARIDVTKTKEKISAIESELKYYEKLYALEDEQYSSDYASKIIQFERGVKDYKADTDSVYTKKEVEAINGGLEEFEEQRALDLKLREFNINCIREEIEDNRKQLENTVLFANHSGYVSYVKDLTASDECETYENICTIADYNDIYVEIMDVPVSDRLFEQYNDCYCIIEGKEYDAVQKPFSAKELQLMQGKKMYCNERITVKGATRLEAGDCIQVVVRNGFKKHILAVPKESVFEDKDGNFVYVQIDGKDQKRSVRTGVEGDGFIEICEGLAEGEFVKREISYLDMSTETKKVIAMQKLKSDGAYIKTETEKNYYAQMDGIIDSVKAVKNQEVATGDVLCTIKTVNAGAKILGMNSEIQNLDAEYEAGQKALDEEIENCRRRSYYDDYVPWGQIYEEIKEGREQGIDVSELADMESRYSEGREIYDYTIASLEVQKRIATLKYEYDRSVQLRELEKQQRDFDGNNRYNIYAKEAGRVSTIAVKDGDVVKPGKLLMSNMKPVKGQVVLYSKKILSPGHRVLIIRDNVSFEGKVIGIDTCSSDRTYVYDNGETAYLSFTKTSSKLNAYYIDVDESFWDVESNSSLESYVYILGEL